MGTAFIAMIVMGILFFAFGVGVFKIALSIILWLLKGVFVSFKFLGIALIALISMNIVTSNLANKTGKAFAKEMKKN